jgi:hypothetical protein
MGCPRNSGIYVDHINRNGLDCRKENLRIATNSQNNMNRGMFKNNTSGYRGVHRKGNMWRAMIYVSGKQIRLGTFKNIKDAASAYNAAAIQYHGEFASLNDVQ